MMIKCTDRTTNRNVYLNENFIRKIVEYEYSDGNLYIAADLNGREYWVYTFDNTQFFGEDADVAKIDREDMKD